MKLFKTDLKREIEQKSDVHGESKISGYCEFCWGWDNLQNLVMVHPVTAPQQHLLGHRTCVEGLSDVVSCTC